MMQWNFHRNREDLKHELWLRYLKKRLVLENMFSQELITNYFLRHYLPENPINFFFSLWKASLFTLLMASDTVLKVIVVMGMTILVQKIVGCKKRTLWKKWMNLKMQMKVINFLHMRGQVNVNLCKHTSLLNL